MDACIDGVDPIDARSAMRQHAILDAGKAITFKEAAGKYINGHKAGWRNAKQRRNGRTRSRPMPIR